jgi:hypothetical protein
MIPEDKKEPWLKHEKEKLKEKGGFRCVFCGKPIEKLHGFCSENCKKEFSKLKDRGLCVNCKKRLNLVDVRLNFCQNCKQSPFFYGGEVIDEFYRLGDEKQELSRKLKE